MIRSIMSAVVLSLASVAFGAPVQVGQSQTWVEFPDFAALAATGTDEDIMDAFRDSLHSVNTLAQNPEGLTLEGALDILGQFNDDVGDPSLPCDDAIAAMYDNINDLDLPGSVLLYIVQEEEDCIDLEKVIDEYRDKIDGSELFQECIEYDPDTGECILKLQNYPCHAGQDCDCVATDEDGNCVLWTNRGPFVFPDNGPGDPPAYDVGGGDDPVDPGLPGGGGGGGDEGEPEPPGGGGGGGGGNPSAAGVTSTEGGCAGHADGDQTSPNGPSQTTKNPTLRSSGYKYEDDTDITISLPGRDFVLRRTYNASPAAASSSTPWMLGGGWGTTVDGWVKYNSFGFNVDTQDHVSLNGLPEYLAVTLMPTQSGKRYFGNTDNTATTFQTGASLGQNAPSDSSVVASTGFAYESQNLDVWVMMGEGAGATYFMKGGGDGSLDPLIGRILRQTDAAGNRWDFKYVFPEDPDGNSAWPRLQSILVNGTTPANSDATLNFEWDMGTSTNPGTGLLRSIVVLRPHKQSSTINPNGLTRLVATQYVNYTYSHDDFYTYGHLEDGSENRLILVEKGSLVNAPLQGESLTPNVFQGFKYHRRFTHFRYKQTIQTKEHVLLNVYNTKTFGLMTHRFEPEQVEYFAEQWLQAQTDPSLTLDDAIDAMLATQLDDDVPGSLPDELEFQDLASKIIRYYGLSDYGRPGSGYREGELAFRVQSQVLQAACGCGGSVNKKAEYFDYARKHYVDREGVLEFDYGNVAVRVDFQSARESSITIFTEGAVASVDAPDDTEIELLASRKTYTWSEEQKVFEAGPVVGQSGGSVYFSIDNVRSPFTIGNHIVDSYTDPAHDKEWTSFHDFNKNKLTRTARYHPSAVDSVDFDPITGLLIFPVPSLVSQVDADDAKAAFNLKDDEGFVELWIYDSNGKMTSRSVKRGKNGSPILIGEYEFSNEAGRGDLLTKKTKYAKNGTDVLSEIDYEYGFHTWIGMRSTEKVMTSKTTKTKTETSDQNGPSSTQWQTTVDTYDSSTGRVLETTHSDGTVTSYSYTHDIGGVLLESFSDEWLTMTREAADSSFVDLVFEQYFDSIGRLRSSVSPAGITTHTEFSLEPVELYSGASGSAVMDGPTKLDYLTLVTYPHDMDPTGNNGTTPRFTGPATKSWATAGLNLLRQDSYVLQDLYVDSDTGAVLMADLAPDPSSMTIHKYSPSGAHTESRVWHDLDAVLVDEGSYLTRYNYDVLGRLNEMTDHSGTVTSTQYDGDNRTIRVWVSPPNAPSPVLRSEYFYDHVLNGTDPESGLGDGNLTLSRQYVSGGSGDYRDTLNVYDWRNRKRMSFVRDNDALSPWTTSISGSASAAILDNQGRPVEVASLKGVDHSVVIADLENDSATSLFGPDAGSLVRTHYGRRGLVYATESAIDPNNESAGFLRIENWYDDAGRPAVSLSPGGAVSKTIFDSFGRPTKVIVTDGHEARTGTASYDMIVSTLPSDNVILEESETQYDDFGRVELSISRIRDHLSQEPGTALTTGLGLNPIVTFSTPVYDVASRPIGSVSYGTNISGSDVFSSGGAPPAIPSEIPNQYANPDWIITETRYDELGRPYMAIDPLGRTHKSLFDDLGRPYASIENFTDNGLDVIWDSVAGHYQVTGRTVFDVDQNRVVSSVFDFAGATVKRLAHLRSGNNEVVQITHYDFDPAFALTPNNQSDLYGNLYQIRYPVPGDGSYQGNDGEAGALPEDTVQFGYNWLGEQIASRDQNGTIRTFSRDSLGRLETEQVTTFGADVDTSVDLLKISYDDQGRVVSNQSFNSNDLVNSLDETVYTYNQRGDLTDLSQLAKAGTTARSFAWEYSTLDFANGNEHRLLAMVYPDGSKFVPDYGDDDLVNPLDSRIDRVRGFSLRESDYDTSLVELGLVQYEHLGLGTVVKSDFGLYQTDRTVQTIADGGLREVAGQYPGWDRFGRLKQHTTVRSSWNGTTQGQLFSEAFDYDNMSNRLNKQDLRLSAFENNRDFAYGYDDLNRLVNTERGIHTNVDLTDDVDVGSRQWSLDELGNWTNVTTQIDSSGGIDSEDRVHNATNELTEIDGVGVLYDDNGNMTQYNGRLFVYDAWNRLVRVHSGTTDTTDIIAEYDYNALHWRVAKRANNSSGVWMQRLMYYTPSWQLAYEEVDSSFDGATHVSDSFASQFWGKRHIDDALYRVIDDNDGVADGIYERGFAYLTDNQFSIIGMFDLMTARAYERLRYDAYGKPTHSYPEDLNDDGALNFFDLTPFNIFLAAGDVRVDFDFDGGANFFEVSPFMQAIANKSIVGSGWISDDGVNGPDNRIGFMGYHWESEVGLWLGRNRMYSPDAGRWLQRDPAGYVDGMSMYLFVRGNPLSYIDPMGLCAEEQVHWHHLLPQDKKLLKQFNAAGITEEVLNSDEFGWLLQKSEHNKVHKKILDQHWNADWKTWFKQMADDGVKVTSQMVRGQLTSMMISDRYRNIFNTGASAAASGVSTYGQWGKKKTDKRAAFTKARTETSNVLNTLANAAESNRNKKVGRAAAKTAAKSLGKAFVIAAPVFFAVDVANGKPVLEAVIDSVSIVSVQDAKRAQQYAQNAVWDRWDAAAQRNTDRIYGPSGLTPPGSD